MKYIGIYLNAGHVSLAYTSVLWPDFEVYRLAIEKAFSGLFAFVRFIFL